MAQFSSRYLLLACAVLLVFAGSCRQSSQPNREPIGTTLNPLANTTQTLAAISTKQPTSSITPMLPPTQSSKPTITQIPTVTPIPTLAFDKAREFVLELLRTNNGCQLPCWWGITPGEAHWEAVEPFLQSFAISLTSNPKETYTEYWAYFPVDESRDIFSALQVYFEVNKEGDVVELIRTVKNGLELHQILEAYGQPAQVWLYATGIPGTGPVVFAMELHYPEKGILASVDGNGTLITKNTKDIIQVCTQKLNKRIGFDLRSPAKALIVENLDWMQDFRLLEEVSNADTSTFYKGFLDPNKTFCIETPFDIWP